MTIPLPNSVTVHHEKPCQTANGWVVLPLNLAMTATGLLFVANSHSLPPPTFWMGLALLIGSVLISKGFFMNAPNQATVLSIAEAFVGTSRRPGLNWTNPFRGKAKISLRARNLNGDKLKVNDLRGNPIEIAAVVVWRVVDCAQAMFDVEDYVKYVAIQSESAIRHVASTYAYDDGEADEMTLRGGGEAVSEALQTELKVRLKKAGVQVEEARIAHLAYAPEIAQAMLRRQQAEAVIAARQKIVTGAVSMVEMALRQLEEKHVVALDDERKAAMVSNLLVVLCGESEVHPVVNAGTLYT